MFNPDLKTDNILENLQNVVKVYITKWELIAFLISLGIFGSIVIFEIPSDIQQYPIFVQRIISKDMYVPANFLYYLTIYVVAFFQHTNQSLYVASVITLSLATTAKFSITRNFISNRSYVSASNPRLSKHSRSVFFTILFSILMLFVFNLPTSKYYYIGQITSNVWHNATVIFLMPFALLLFLLSYKQLVNPNKINILFITILCLLNVVIKPSFFFVFAVVYPLMLIRCFGLTRRFLYNLIPVVFGMIALAIVYYFLYVLNIGSFSSEKSGIAIKPFFVWSTYSPNILLSLFLSLLFPITFFLFRWKYLFKKLIVQYAVALYLLGILIYSLFVETGPRELDANFSWQCIVCSYILFLVLSKLFVKQIASRGLNGWANKLVLSTFILHSVSGLVYVAKFFAIKEFL